MLPWQPFLAFYIWGAHWRHLKNTTKPSMCGGDAALCQITLTTCFFSEYCSWLFVTVCYLLPVCWKLTCTILPTTVNLWLQLLHAAYCCSCCCLCFTDVQFITRLPKPLFTCTFVLQYQWSRSFFLPPFIHSKPWIYSKASQCPFV